jgi:hypothetical protein
MLCAMMPCEHPVPQTGSGPLAGLPEPKALPVTSVAVLVTVTAAALAPLLAPPPNATIVLPASPPLPPVPPILSAWIAGNRYPMW